MSERLQLLARRVQDDSYFLASALADYAQSEDLDDRGLARVLKCSVETLPALRLCRRPRADPAYFGNDIATIALRLHVDAVTLAQVVRRADVLVALRQAATSERGILMAARDRQDDESEVDAGSQHEVEGEQS